MSKDFKKTAASYFEAFSQKNLSKLRDMFDDNVILRDWEIKEEGIENVLQANSRIFQGVKTITAIPLNILSEGNLISAELEITINSRDQLKVVDLIEFNSSGKIVSIKAFKG